MVYVSFITLNHRPRQHSAIVPVSTEPSLSGQGNSWRHDGAIVLVNAVQLLLKPKKCNRPRLLRVVDEVGGK
eukprot:4544081-Pleurochrysis_carterae.AAC.1